MILIAMCTALVAVIASVSGLNVAQQQLAVDLGAIAEPAAVGDQRLHDRPRRAAPADRRDRRPLGRKPILLGGLSLFAVANVLAALATTTRRC